MPRAKCRSVAWILLGWLAGGWSAPPAFAHEIPNDVTVQIIVRPAGDRLQLLVRAPLEAMQDINFPTFGQGYLDIARADAQLRNAAIQWLANDIELYEQQRRLALTEPLAVRASIPSDRSFADYAAALAHVRGERLPDGTELVWQQALLDVLFEVPIDSDRSAFSVRPRLERLGLTVATVIRFVAPDGVVRVYQIDGGEELVPLDPSWHQAALRFVGQGFAHILDGTDHLLFLLCLVLPFRRDFRALVWIVTAFTVAHSVTLIASAYGLAPDVLWFAPLVEVLIAASILYMAIENVVVPKLRMRWIIALAFGLIHGFGFSFALRNTLQFAGDHVLTSLLAFNVGVELGQLLVLALLIPLLGVLFRYVVQERIGSIILTVVIAHTAWHWMAERYAVLREFRLRWPDLAAAAADSGLRWLALGIVVATLGGVAIRRIVKRSGLDHRVRGP